MVFDGWLASWQNLLLNSPLMPQLSYNIQEYQRCFASRLGDGLSVE